MGKNHPFFMGFFHMKTMIFIGFSSSCWGSPMTMEKPHLWGPLSLAVFPELEIGQPSEQQAVSPRLGQWGDGPAGCTGERNHDAAHSVLFRDYRAPKSRYWSQEDRGTHAMSFCTHSGMWGTPQRNMPHPSTSVDLRNKSFISQSTSSSAPWASMQFICDVVSTVFDQVFQPGRWNRAAMGSFCCPLSRDVPGLEMSQKQSRNSPLGPWHDERLENSAPPEGLDPRRWLKVDLEAATYGMAKPV